MIIITGNIFGAIGAFFCSVASAVVGAISSVGAIIATTVAKVGSAIVGFAKSAIAFLGPLANTIEKLGEILTTVSNIIHDAVTILGIFSKDNPEELGLKAAEADKTLEDFDYDTEAYIKYLNEEIELDEKKLAELTPEEKIAARATGMALEIKAIEDKVGITITPDFPATLAKIQAGSDIVINGKELALLLTSLKDSGITTTDDLIKYLEGEGDSDRFKTENALIKAVGEIDSVTDPEAYIEAMKDAVRKEPDNNGNS